MGRKNAPFLVRVTGILEEDGELLIIQQKMSDGRKWYLPGGQLEAGETIEQGIVREMREETGLQRLAGAIHVPHCTYDTVEITDVQFVPFDMLKSYGFSDRFVSMVKDGFPLSNRYIGLDTFFDFFN